MQMVTLFHIYGRIFAYFPTSSHFPAVSTATGHGAYPSRRAARRGPRWWRRPQSASRAARRWGRSCRRFRPGTNVRKASRPGRMLIWRMFFGISLFVGRFLWRCFGYLKILFWRIPRRLKQVEMDLPQGWAENHSGMRARPWYSGSIPKILNWLKTWT